MEFQLQSNDTASTQIEEELSAKKEALIDLLNYDTEGAFIRSRAKYKLEGEKPTSFFCALEKVNGVQKYIPQLLITDENGDKKIVDQQSEIEEEIFGFYRDLFSNKDHLLANGTVENFLGPSSSNIPKLTDTQKQNMEGNITLSELTCFLKKCKNNVSPGSTGYTFEFYKFFWRNLKHHIVNAVSYAFENDRLSVSQSRGVINIIPKGDKDKRLLTNWRPLCLLNSMYKLISGTLAERIKPNLNTIIHSDQKGFVPGRCIGEVVRTT